MISLLLILGTLVSTLQAIRATHAERLAASRLVTETAARREADEQRRAAEAAAGPGTGRGPAQGRGPARGEADANLRKAREAVDRMLTRVATERLLAVPQMEPVRRAILEDALEFYRGFLKEHGTDPAIRHQTGQAYLWTGKIHSVLGKNAQSEEAVRQAAALFEKLVAEFPSVPEYRASLALARRRSAYPLQHLGRIQEAEATFRGSVELWRALVAEFPANLEYREGYSVAARDYGTLLVDLGRHGEAEDLFRQARLIEGKQGIAPWRHGPTEEQHLMAQTGRPQEAETHFRQAIQAQKDKLARSPDDPDLRFSLAYTQLI